jgi:predicted methyltransferase
MNRLAIFVVMISLAMHSFAQMSDVISSAVGNSARPDKDVRRDENRKPGEVISFIGIEPTMKVLDVFAGGGYYSEILSYVVGSEGEVTLYNNGSWNRFVQKELAKRFLDNRLPNVSSLVREANDLSLSPEYYDAALFILGFHDLFYEDAQYGWTKIDAPRFLRAIFDSLKPNGVLGVVDHLAEIGAPISTAQDLHRIDIRIIEEQLEDAGFVLEASSELLRNPLDDHLKPMSDSSIRGRTDRVLLRFRKPRR